MCLITNKNKLSEVNKPLTVYKVLYIKCQHDSDGNGNIEQEIFLHSPYQFFLYKVNTLYKVKKINIHERINKYISMLHPEYPNRVEVGFHSFLRRKDAQLASEQLGYSIFGKSIVVKCTIPTGTKIITGVWGDDGTTKIIVSDKIIIYNK